MTNLYYYIGLALVPILGGLIIKNIFFEPKQPIQQPIQQQEGPVRLWRKGSEFIEGGKLSKKKKLTKNKSKKRNQKRINNK